jgi:ribosomal protein S18 acetylase RimI-like enzyme
MPYRLRRATPDDLGVLVARSRLLSDHESIVVSDADIERAMGRLLGDAGLGGAWLIEDGGVIGHVIVTWGYDIEFAGRDAWLTELWVDEAARGHGAATAALALLDAELREHEVRALHLQVRSENPAVRLYERSGFEHVPRVVMTRRM